MKCPKEGCMGKLVVGRVVVEDEHVDVDFVCDQDEKHRFFCRIHEEDLIVAD